MHPGHPDKSFAQNLEFSYVAISPDSRTAWLPPYLAKVNAAPRTARDCKVGSASAWPLAASASSLAMTRNRSLRLGDGEPAKFLSLYAGL